ncbi:MAG: hypothetical protein OS130_10960 [Thermodesulfobacteriota bacterium]|nr:MAG: hypothetical protein OS130_10960 [Thermodesulfobacteriota bacterium]
MKVRVIHSKNLSSECWLVQTWDLNYCQTCKFKGTKACGGKRIRQTRKNLLGKKVPIE